MSETQQPRVALPHPWLTTFEIVPEQQQQEEVTRLVKVERDQEQPPPVDIYHPSLTFTEPSDDADWDEDSIPPGEENTPWARAMRCLFTKLAWSSNEAPTVAQIWTVIYALITLYPAEEAFRLTLSGQQAESLRSQLKAVGLALPFPLPTTGEGNKEAISLKLPETKDELVVPRSLFWQGAGSPFGTRAPWAPDAYSGLDKDRPLSSFPVMPLEHTFTHNLPKSRVFARHPIRPVKPTPGSVVYSRYIPHLDEHLSLVALDRENEEHVRLFNKWQNDPRVANVWEETGTLEQHGEYLRNAHEDEHLIPLLGRFNDEYFAYFEVYWARENSIGAYYDAGDFDRGWHALVGEDRFRGPHRVRAWMSAVMHYMFLDDPRTMRIVGEPRSSGHKIIAYEVEHGFHIDKTFDFPHKRAALVICSRENFFRLCQFHWEDDPAAGKVSRDRK